MAKQRKDWKLSDLSFISTKEQKVEIEKPKHAETVVTLISHVNDEDALLAHINAIEKRGVVVRMVRLLRLLSQSLTFLLTTSMRTFSPTLVFSSVLLLTPRLFVDRALAKVKKMFPNLPEEQLNAMAAMLRDSVEG